MERIRKLREQMRMGKTIYELPLRVTFYARVSTEKLEQQGSLQHQIDYYTEQIRKNESWVFVPGYVDEGISGTSTYKRESFLRMIADAHGGCFDFIITKEISRFSRSTLDSIRYTQELLEAGVGVLFQNDQINTLDPDSEFRLVVMAGVAQDEVRKLSERLKFGFRQSIQGGRILGNDCIWGYEKKDCRLSIQEEQAQVVRMIFTLYASGQYGVRRLARVLTAHGYGSRTGKGFSEATIRSILRNPKYKGWYCGHKTQSLDYRTKRREVLPPEEWVMYPDPNIPAIVSEELWDHANAILRSRGQKARAHAPAAQNRYPYSGKIFCQTHEMPCHRRQFHTADGEIEYWSCRMYRLQGRKGCCLPNVRTQELNQVMTVLLPEIPWDRQAVFTLVEQSIQQGRQEVRVPLDVLRKQEIQLGRRKERLLELCLEGHLSKAEFHTQNERYDAQLSRLQDEIQTCKAVQSQSDRAHEKLVRAMEQEFMGTLHEEVAAALLEKAVICADSSREKIHLQLSFGLGQTASVFFSRKPFTLCSKPCLQYAPPNADCAR